MDIEYAKRYIQKEMEYHLEDVQHLSGQVWVARATTTHNMRMWGDPERTFGIIVEGERFTTLELDSIPHLLAWCQQQEERRHRTHDNS